MKVVVGAGAWGLPAGAELARRGHRVTVLDRYGTGNLLASSSGPTRLWRLGDPDPLRVRLAQRAADATERLVRLAGLPLHRRLGLLWRDDSSLVPLLRAVREAGVAHEVVPADRVDERLPACGSMADRRSGFRTRASSSP